MPSVNIVNSAVAESGKMTRLAAMFFVQFLVWGVWFVPFGSYLSAQGLSGIVGFAFGMQGLAALLSPLIVGWIANRYMSAERLMAFLFAGAGAFCSCCLALCRVHS